MQLAYPINLGRQGLIETATPADHLNQMIEQVLFTKPGERVNRPDFGCALQTLVFDDANAELIAVTQSVVQGSLQKWLGDIIQVERVQVAVQESMVSIAVQYVSLRTKERKVARYQRHG